MNYEFPQLFGSDDMRNIFTLNNPQLYRKNSNNKGFTLVELIVVIVVLAVMAAILVPALLGYIDKAKKEKNYQAAQEVHTAVQALATESYGKGDSTPKMTLADIKNLAGIEDLAEVNVQWKNTASNEKTKFQVEAMSVKFTSDSSPVYYTYKRGDDSKYSWQSETTNSITDEGVSTYK